MSIEVRKNDYQVEFARLIREQYKESPSFCHLLERKGIMAQSLENALFSIHELNDNFGVIEGLGRDSLNRTGEMFGVITPQLLSTQDLLDEIKCFLVKAFSRTNVSDFNYVTRFIYRYDSDIIDLDGGIYLVVYGDITSDDAKRGRLLFRCFSGMMPAYTRVYGVIQSGYGYFGFNGPTSPANPGGVKFKPFENGKFRQTPASIPDSDSRSARMAQLVIDENGNNVLALVGTEN